MSTSNSSMLQLTSTSSSPEAPAQAMPTREVRSGSRGSRSSSSSSVRNGHVKPPKPKALRNYGSFPGSGALVPHPGTRAQASTPSSGPGLPQPQVSSTVDFPMSSGSGVPSNCPQPDSQSYPEVHLHQHRNLQQNIQVGLDPVQVAQEARNFQQSVTQEAAKHVHHAQQQAAQQVQSARAHLIELSDQVRTESIHAINKMRKEFQQEAQAREARLVSEVRAQAHERERELATQVQTLQAQLTVLQHQNRQPEVSAPSPTSLNGADVMQCLNDLRAELHAMKSNVAAHAPPLRAHVDPSTIPQSIAPANHPFGAGNGGLLDPNLASLVHSTASACAGIPPPGPNVFESQVGGYPGHQQQPALPIAASIRQAPSPRHASPSPVHNSSSSSSSSRTPRGGGGPPGGSPNPSVQGSPQGSVHSRRSQGIGSGIVVDENEVYKYKDLALINIDTLPRDAAHFRSWRNSFITRLCSIDRTGRDTLLHWIMPAFEVTEPADLSDPGMLPRLDAHIASLLADPKHMSSELGIQFQSYIESCQLAYTAPKGRVLLQMVARRYFLDLRRGANLTEQALLELQLESFTHQSLVNFVNRVEYILNAIPPDLQPSEQTRFTWLFSRLKRCRIIQRHIDRIKDAREGSHVRTWDWLFGKLKQTIAEMREDANETAIRDSLGTNTKPQDDKAKAQKERERRAKAKAAVASGKGGEAPAATEDQTPALPNKPKGPKGAGKKGTPKAKGHGKGDEKGKGKGGAKGQGGKPPGGQPPPPKQPSGGAPPKETSAKAPCLFWPKGTCRRGKECPYAHDQANAPKTKSSSSFATTAAATATVAYIVPAVTNTASVCGQGLPKPSAPLAAPVSSPTRGLEQTCTVHTGLKAKSSNPKSVESSFYARSGLKTFFRWFSGWFTVLSSTAMPALLPKAKEVALPGYQPGPFQLEWIADSGAGRNLTSLKALERQGMPPDVGLQASQVEQPIQFSTGNGVVTSHEVLTCNGQDFGKSTAYLMSDCPVVRSMGEIVNGGQLPFLWLPGQLPCFLKSSQYVQANFSGALFADRVEGNVPIFKEQVSFAFSAKASPVRSSAPSALPSSVPAPGPEVPVESPGRAPAIGEGGANSGSEDGEEPLSKDVRLVREAASVELS